MSKQEIPAVCTSCRGTPEPLTEADLLSYAPAVPEWQLADDQKSISRTFACKSHQDAIAFIVATAAIAEAQDHHPDHHLFKYKRVAFTLTTHAAKGLTVNDYVMARLIDQAWETRP